MRDAAVSKRGADRDSTHRGIQDLAVIETILRNRYHFFQEIRDGIGLSDKMRAMLISSILFLALYGAVILLERRLLAWQRRPVIPSSVQEPT